MTLTADHIPALLDDLGAANAELKALALQAPSHWNRGLPGKWTLGQHVQHVGLMLALTAARLEEALAQLREGRLPPVPRRGILQRVFIAIATGRRFPRGGKAIEASTPVGAMDRDPAFARLDDGARRHRSVAGALTREEQERLWVANPFTHFRWHYTLPEILRVHANHTRLHVRHCAEILFAAGIAAAQR